jgi:Beta-xylosidase
MKQLKTCFIIFCLHFSIINGYAQSTHIPINKTIKIQNPILPGFNPDPCIVRVHNDYYIVTSSFEWFPGIPIYHSTDLIQWKQIGHVLDEKSQLDLTGVDDADGVYAPSITYHKGTYYVMFTNVQNGIDWPQKGYPNYIVTATNPAGPWSEAIYVNSLGFDPTLFIEEDGSAYILIRIMDHRKGKGASPGIGMHAYDLSTMKPIGEPLLIYSGWAKQSAEGPKMLKKDGFYYLFTAEGGTGYGHYEAVARSKNIWGPYERAPKIFYSSADAPDNPVQKAGHGTLFTTPDGQWYTTHLGSRPLNPRDNCSLGRETFIQKIEWDKDGWPVLADGSTIPKIEVSIPVKTIIEVDQQQYCDMFRKSKLSPEWQTLREPANDSWLTINPSKGILSMRGRHALGSRFRESLIAQRITSYQQDFETCIEFNPTNYRHTAGLTCYYNTCHFFSLALTHDDEGKVLKLTEADKEYNELLKIKLPDNLIEKVYMKIHIDGYNLQYSYSFDGTKWESIGKVLDFGKISDDYAKGYTGAMVGLFVSDQMYEDKWANFHYFKVTTNK